MGGEDEDEKAQESAGLQECGEKEILRAHGGVRGRKKQLQDGLS